jgi:hypothetical protein
MTLGGSIFLIALGAILAFAVDFQISGLEINVIGYILMIAGVIGLILSLFFRAQATSGTTRRRTTVEERDPDVRRDF